MNVLRSRDALNALAMQRSDACVSIYMATHRAGVETEQDPILLRNLLRESEQLLLSKGLSIPQVQDLLEPAARLRWDSLFWMHQSDGLVVFLGVGEPHLFRLPLPFEPLVVVTNRFHIKPLLPLFSEDERFYLLGLSQNRISLFQGTRFSISELEPQGLPASIAETLQYDVFEKQLQFHTRTPPSGPQGVRSAIFHGQGVGSDDTKVNILRYLQQINEGMSALLKGEQAPLVLAGVGYLLGLYRQVNDYPHLLEQGIEGNPEGLSVDELHRQAWRLVRPHVLEARENAIHEYRQRAGTARASSDVAAIIRSARQGQVETLLVAVGRQIWGVADQDAGTVEIHRERVADDEDLLDLATILALSTGATIFAVRPELVPATSGIAAVFRYPILVGL